MELEGLGMSILMDTVLSLLCAVMFVGGAGLLVYVAITEYDKGWQYLGNQFDAIADKVWHIDNVYEGDK